MKKTCLLLFTLSLIFIACNNNAEEKKPATTTVKEDSVKNKPEPAPATETRRAPIINITDTVSEKRLVIYMKDSSASADRINMKLTEILSFKLAAVIKKNNIKSTGRPIAWYNTNKAPYFFEAGIPVDKKPGKLPSNVFIREMGVDSVTVAHFYGAYDLLPQAYDALSDRLKDHKKTIKSKPYEIYVDESIDSTGKAKDPYKVQTDIVFPWQ